MKVINTKLIGLGGQGVVLASDILAEVLLCSGFDVKKSEVKGMSRRGGTVTSDVRFGKRVFSPMITRGEADFILLLDPTQTEIANYWRRAGGGVILDANQINHSKLPHHKTFNIAMLGMLNAHLSVAEEIWQTALKESFINSFYNNWQAFLLGQASAKRPS